MDTYTCLTFEKLHRTSFSSWSLNSYERLIASLATAAKHSVIGSFVIISFIAFLLNISNAFDVWFLFLACLPLAAIGLADDFFDLELRIHKNYLRCARICRNVLKLCESCRNCRLSAFVACWNNNLAFWWSKWNKKLIVKFRCCD